MTPRILVSTFRRKQVSPKRSYLSASHPVRLILKVFRAFDVNFVFSLHHVVCALQSVTSHNVTSSNTNFTLFTPCIVDYQITTLGPTKCTIFFPDILYYNVTLNTATCFDPLWYHHQGNTLKYYFTKLN
jgi:hypothetical protein